MVDDSHRSQQPINVAFDSICRMLCASRMSLYESLGRPNQMAQPLLLIQLFRLAVPQLPREINQSINENELLSYKQMQ